MADRSQARIDLEARAVAAQVEFAANIGDEKLAERVEAAEAEAKADAQSEAKADAEAKAKADAKGKAKAKADAEAVVRVTGPKRGRWRCGRHFTPEPVDIPAGDLSGSEMEALKGDAKLVVLEIEGK